MNPKKTQVRAKTVNTSKNESERYEKLSLA